MKFDQIAPFMRSIILSATRHSGHEVMIGYECRIFYLVKGTGELEIQGTPHTLQKGDLVIINSGVPYKILFPRNMVRFYMIKFDVDHSHTDIATGTSGDRPCDFDSQRIISHMDFEDAPLFNDFCILPGMHHLEKLVVRIYSEEHRKLIGWRTRANSLLGEILTECVRAETGYYDTSRLKDVLDYLQVAYVEPISNAQIAERFGYHPNYLSSLFRKVTGRSLHKYLLSLRMTRAVELLEASSLPIGDVAERCGFENVSNFSAAFRKETGMTPTQCRKNGQKA